MKKEIVLTGLRPTGKLHIGHFAGAMQNILELQNSGKYEMNIFIADYQALTDNANDPEKIKESVWQVAIDFLSVGISPEKCTLFIQSQIPELCEMTNCFLNLVSVSRLQRIPTIKDEIKQRNFEKTIPMGFLAYPVSQASDILAFNTDVVPGGEDQEPLIEVTREIARTFNQYYGNVLKEPKMLLSENVNARRVVGIDGNAKMSKSLGNCIYLSDSEKELKDKVMKMYTDPGHIHVEDPGKVEGNVVFKYLDVFCKDKQKVEQLKVQYRKGGLGDVTLKKFLFEVLNNILSPIREKRAYYEAHLDDVKRIFNDGSKKASIAAKNTLARMRKAIGVDYFD